MEKYTREQLKTAFEKVQNKEHWKNPIDAIIPKQDMDITADAIHFFTGTQAFFNSNGLTVKQIQDGCIRVVADGYYLGPCN